MRKILVLLALTLVVGGAALAQDAGERPFLGITFRRKTTVPSFAKCWPTRRRPQPGCR